MQNPSHKPATQIEPSLLIGPITQLLPMAGLPLKGPLEDKDLAPLLRQGIVIGGSDLLEIADYNSLYLQHKQAIENKQVQHIHLSHPMVALPGFIDAHTHICYAGDRAADYALRNSGASYLDIAKEGGGIWSSIGSTRAASQEELVQNTLKNAQRHLSQGVTTIEVKSGYAGSVSEELKMLRAIQKANEESPADLISCCLAAHIFPKDYPGSPVNYLNEIVQDLFPILVQENLTHRVDAFIEQTAFTPSVIGPYLEAAKAHGFDLCIHADQFSTAGSQVAIQYGALSADHLEASTQKEIQALAASNTLAMALPGASLGLGMGFAPARALLDAGAGLVIASDWNPGSAPMGHLLCQAALLGAAEKLSHAEVLAGISYRAAAALALTDRGVLSTGKMADILLFPTAHYRNILYQQGMMGPSMIFKSGQLVYKK